MVAQQIESIAPVPRVPHAQNRGPMDIIEGFDRFMAA